MAAVVTVQNLRKRYRRRDPWAVDGVTFDLQPGQAFGLLGPNGAGKTSVVKMIAGLLRPDSGSITLFGTDPGNPVARKDLGFSPEDPDFPKFLSEVERVCDTVAILARGRVLKEGTMAEVVPEGSNLEDVFVQLVEANQPQRDHLPSFISDATP